MNAYKHDCTDHHDGGTFSFPVVQVAEEWSQDRIKGYGLELPNIQKDADKYLAEEMIGEGQR